jgi:hypothetical protein
MYQKGWVHRDVSRGNILILRPAEPRCMPEQYVSRASSASQG